MGPQWWILVLLTIFPLVQTSNTGENFHHRHFYGQIRTINSYVMIYYNSIITAIWRRFKIHTNHTGISRHCVEINVKMIVLWCIGALFFNSRRFSRCKFKRMKTPFSINNQRSFSATLTQTLFKNNAQLTASHATHAQFMLTNTIFTTHLDS